MKINIYTIPECSFCSKLKGLLDDSNIKYDEFNIYDEENEGMFNRLMNISGGDSVPMITVGNHLLAPDINFTSIEQAAEIIKHILDTEIEK